MADSSGQQQVGLGAGVEILGSAGVEEKGEEGGLQCLGREGGGGGGNWPRVTVVRAGGASGAAWLIVPCMQPYGGTMVDTEVGVVAVVVPACDYIGRGGGVRVRGGRGMTGRQMGKDAPALVRLCDCVYVRAGRG